MTKKDNNSCFLKQLFFIIESRKSAVPENSYTASLYKKGKKTILDKIEEETLEVVKASQEEGTERTIKEACDLIYHLFVLLSYQNINFADIEKELRNRHAEKT